jgi:23S rRNA (uracil1939-C5)-methyltransferase
LVELDQVEVTIEKLVAGGEGIGRFEGIPIFVPRSAPGDRVRVELFERRPDYGRGEIVELLAPGPGRREPPCPHFGACGGCDLQHLDEKTQLAQKSAALMETLTRLSGLAVPAPRAIVAGASWGYRLRAQIHTRRAAGGHQVGYHARRSREVVPVRSCAVLVPELERELVTLGRRLPSAAPARIDVAAGDGGTVSYAPLLEGLPHGELSRRVGSFDYAYDSRCFFQGHAGLLGALVEIVVGDATGATAFDLYGGVGLFSLPLARRYTKVVLVEGDRIASRFARRNARTAKLANVEVAALAVESWIGGGLPDGADRVVVDPPRDGLSPTVRSLLVGRAPRRLTYVSCHAAALARDLKALASAFEIESLVLVDLFPQTGHMEAVVQLRNRAVTAEGADGAAGAAGAAPGVEHRE